MGYWDRNEDFARKYVRREQSQYKTHTFGQIKLVVELSYNIYGYINSVGVNEIDLEIFVSEFVVNERRKRLFEKYSAFNTDLQGLILQPFCQWIDGSFISKQPFPNDIDVVTFVPHYIYEEREDALRALVKKYTGVDAYFVKDYPADHPNRFVTDFDMTEWLFLFSTDRRRRNKGFIQINF